jgi:hemerythrin
MEKRVLFEWTDDLSVSIEEIDNQHKVLIDIINQLFLAVVHRQSDKIIGEILDALMDYTRTHFELEENLMRGAGYGGEEFENHLAIHRAFVEKMEAIAYKVMVENKAVSFELMNYLKHWLRDHIMVTDRKYAHALRQAGYSTQSWEASARVAAYASVRPWWKFW